MTPNSELFPASEGAMLSPNLAWLQRNRLMTAHDPDMLPGTESPETGQDLLAWVCFRLGEKVIETHSPSGFGNTEDEACADFAIKAGIPLWNEEAKP